MNFILSLFKSAFGGSTDIDGIVAPMRKIVAKLNAHAEASYQAADEKEKRGAEILAEADAHDADAKRAKALSEQYGKLIGI